MNRTPLLEHLRQRKHGKQRYYSCRSVTGAPGEVARIPAMHRPRLTASTPQLLTNPQKELAEAAEWDSVLCSQSQGHRASLAEQGGRSESPACLAPVTREAGCGRVPAPTLRLCLGVRKSVFQVMVSSLLVQNRCWAFKGRRTEDEVRGKEGGLRIPCPRCQQSTLAFNHFVCWEISFEEQNKPSHQCGHWKGFSLPFPVESLQSWGGRLSRLPGR